MALQGERLCCGTAYNQLHYDKCTTKGDAMNLDECTPARLLDEYHEDFGAVLWWKFPIVEPPYLGSPLDTEWPGYHTHWTAISLPVQP